MIHSFSLLYNVVKIVGISISVVKPIVFGSREPFKVDLSHKGSKFVQDEKGGLVFFSERRSVLVSNVKDFILDDIELVLDVTQILTLLMNKFVLEVEKAIMDGQKGIEV